MFFFIILNKYLSVKYKGYDFIVDVNGKVVKDTKRVRISATNYDCIPTSHELLSETMNKANICQNPVDEYGAYWTDNYYLTTAGSIAISKTTAKKYMLSWGNYYPSSTNNNIKATEALLDTSARRGFTTGLSDVQTVCLTIKMIVARWNGIRPLVILPDGVKESKDADEIWIIQ